MYTLPYADPLTGGRSGIVREDGAFIPEDDGNLDWRAYQEWLAGGNKPAPAPVIESIPNPDAIARQAAIDKLVSSGLLTEAEAVALAGG